MKNINFKKVITVALSCLLLVGVAFGISAFAETAGVATSVEIEYKNVSYTGAPSLVYYVGTDAPLAENQKVKVFFWNEKVENGIYNEYNADYSKESVSEATIEGSNYYTVLGEGVAPSEVRMTVFARPALVEVAEDGSEKVVSFGTLIEYSIFDYALDMFNAKLNGERASAAEDQVELYKTFLNYAASIQEKLFTNAYNGVLNEEKLQAVGGWANEFYVVQVNRYLYDSRLNEYVAENDYIRYSARQENAPIVLNADMYYEKNGTKYSFKSYRDSDGNPLNLIKTLGTGEHITSSSIFSNVYETSATKEGIVEYNMYYGVETGHYISFDGGQSIGVLGKTDYWNQFDVTSVDCASDLKPASITRYYYVHDSSSEPVEAKYFFTQNGGEGSTFLDYHYIAVKNSDNSLATKKITTSSDYTFYDVNASYESSTYPKVTKEVVQMNSRGYAEVVQAPAGSDSSRGNVLSFVKHFYDWNDENKTTYMIGPDYQNSVNKKYKSNGYVQALGSLNISATGESASMLTANGSITFKNYSPTAIEDVEQPAVHVFDFDFYISSDQYGTSLVQILMNSSAANILKVNLGLDSSTGVYLYSETEPAGTGYCADGTTTLPKYSSTSSEVILAGSNGGTTVGKRMDTEKWYNLRIEYIDGADGNATVLFYIDGELVSYIRGTAVGNDSDMATCQFYFATATRCSYFYADNLYVGTEGIYEKASTGDEGGDSGSSSILPDDEYYQAVYQNGFGDYHGKGDYYDLAAQVDKSYKPANGLSKGVSIIDEKLSDGTKNMALQLLKTSTSGMSASVAADNPNGNLYIFETDVKVLDGDIVGQWMLKLALVKSAISSPNNDNTMASVCITYMDGYWTISNYGAICKSDLKLKLGVWHNLRFEFNPANDEMTIWINGEKVYNLVGYPLGDGKIDTSFAGVNMNMRGSPSGTHGEIMFDNMYATTEYRDYKDAGENYSAATNKYDGESNGYLTTGNTTIDKTPAHNKGHEYIFETDVRWNGATFTGTDAATAKVLDFVMKSGQNDIFSMTGVTTNNSESDLMLKIGTTTVATLAHDYWMNLRVVYKPHDAEIIDDVEVNKATYEIYINNALAYSTTVESESAPTFDNAVLTVASAETGVTPSIDIDNLYVGTRYIDDLGNGENYSSSNQYDTGSLAITESETFKPSISIGSSYLFEADIKWSSGNGTITLVSTSGNDFTVYIIDNEDGYAYLSLTNDKSGKFFEIYKGVWYNIQIVAEKGTDKDIYDVNIGGKNKARVENHAFAANCINTTIAATGLTVDNTYMYVENKSYTGQGVNKGDAFSSYIDAVSRGDIVFDPNIADANPDNKYTDAYVTAQKNQIIIGKNTAMSENIVSFLGGRVASTHIFESDITWAGSDFGVETPIAGTDNKAVFFTIAIKGADGTVLTTIYAAGIYNKDTVDKTIEFLGLYKSLDDVKNDKAFAYIAKDVTFNLRVEYKATGEFSVFVNNKLATTGTGAASASMTGTDVALGNQIYDTKITLKNTVVISK